MGLGISVKLVLRTFSVLSGPLITLIYPLYASIKAIESNSNCGIQQWLTYWVLFGLISLLELFLAKVLKWLLFWPYAKVMTTLWLVLPFFSGADYVYENFVRPCYAYAVNLQRFCIWFILQRKDLNLRPDEFLVVAERYIHNNGTEALEKLISKDKSEVPNLASTDLGPPKEAQKTCSYATCHVSTVPIEGNFKGCIDGKKQKSKEDTFWANKTASKSKDGYGLMLQTPNRVDLGEDFNYLAGVVFRSLNLCLNPVARRIQWCTWDKPDIGWTKLNTDGSIYAGYASFGGLLRDYMGSPICAFVSKAPREGIFLIELWAIWRGLILALGHGVKAIWVESDAMSVVKAINKDWPYPQKAGSCLKNVWKLLKKFEKYQVSHSWREANRAADYLAKMNLNGRDSVLWPVDFPKRLHNIVKEDAEGKKYSRH